MADKENGSIISIDGSEIRLSEKREVGKVSPEERDEIKGLYERKTGLAELAKTIATLPREQLENNPLYDKLTMDMGRVATSFQKWWDDKSTEHQWENKPGHSWEIDFETCTIYIKRQ